MAGYFLDSFCTLDETVRVVLKRKLERTHSLGDLTRVY